MPGATGRTTRGTPSSRSHPSILLSVSDTVAIPLSEDASTHLEVGAVAADVAALEGIVGASRRNDVNRRGAVRPYDQAHLADRRVEVVAHLVGMGGATGSDDDSDESSGDEQAAMQRCGHSSPRKKMPRGAPMNPDPSRLGISGRRRHPRAVTEASPEMTSPRPPAWSGLDRGPVSSGVSGNACR